MAFKIESVRAFISEDENGEEGILAMSAGLVMMPMICADQARFERMRPLALSIAMMMKKRVKVIKLSQREDLEILYDPEVKES